MLTREWIALVIACGCGLVAVLTSEEAYAEDDEPHDVGDVEPSLALVLIHHVAVYATGEAQKIPPGPLKKQGGGEGEACQPPIPMPPDGGVGGQGISLDRPADRARYRHDRGGLGYIDDEDGVAGGRAPPRAL